MTARRKPAWVSPSLAAMPDGVIPAYEVKFLVPEPIARRVEEWAAGHLTPDPYTDPALGNRYRVTSLYFDTPAFDVFRRTVGHRGRKHRVRRYGSEEIVHLERKSKRDGRVWKQRTPLAADQLERALADPAASGTGWFALELADLGLRPACRVTYERAAFVGTGPTGPIRVTLDRAAVGTAADGPDVRPVADGLPLLAGAAVVEFKYLAAMPAVFKAAIEELRLSPSGMSKYRTCAAAAGLVPEGPADA